MTLKFAAACLALAVSSGLVGSTAARADADCPQAPKEKWMSEADMKKKIADLGYTHDVFKVSGHCYEIYGKNKDGKEVEVYFNPVDGSIVKEEIEDKS